MLTAKQHQLLLFIHDRLSETGVSPSFDEMKDALGLKSKSGVHRLIGALEERGFIRRLANRARALEILRLPDGFDGVADNAGRDATVVRGRFPAMPKAVPVAGPTVSPAAPIAHSGRDVSTVRQGPSVVDIPLHGRIAAGTPIEAIERPDSYIQVPEGLTGGGDACYALEVDGDSMVDLGILDGDTVLIESCETARDGEVVVALVDREEATLKTVRRQGRHVALIPANRTHDTQIYEAERVQIQGRLVGLYRRYH